MWLLDCIYQHRSDFLRQIPDIEILLEEGLLFSPEKERRATTSEAEGTSKILQFSRVKNTYSENVSLKKFEDSDLFFL